MSRICPNTKDICTSFRCEGGCYWGTNAGSGTRAPARGTETPRTKALLDGIKDRRNARGFHMPQDIDDAEEHASKLERELSFAQEQIAALREALEAIRDMDNTNAYEGPRVAKEALAATRKEDSDG